MIGENSGLLPLLSSAGATYRGGNVGHLATEHIFDGGGYSIGSTQNIEPN